MDTQAFEFAQQAITALEAMAAPQPHWTAALGSVGGLAIGLVQCGLIYVGLQRMGQASEERKVQHQESMQTMQTQHEETMAVLKQQGEERKTQHEETMTALQQQGAVLADIGAGIRELLRDRNG